MSNELTEHSQQGLLPADEGARVMHIDKSTGAANFSAIIGHLAQYANLANIANSARRATQYVVQVPTHLQSALDSGKYTMLQGAESGKTWATIVEKLPDGKNKFIANCPIREEAFYQGNPFQDASMSIANLQLQHQMAALAEMLGKTYEAILRVEAGQRADRIGQLNAGRDGIIHALKMKDAESRKMAIAVARGSLQEAQGKIGEVLKQKIDSFEPLSKYQAVLFFRNVFHKSYLGERDDDYNTIYDYFELYLQATELIAQSFLVCGEEESAASVYDTCRQFISGLDFRKLETVLYSHSGKKREDLFFAQARARIDRSKALCLEAAKPYDYIELEISGEDLQEGINLGRQ